MPPPLASFLAKLILYAIVTHLVFGCVCLRVEVQVRTRASSPPSFVPLLSLIACRDHRGRRLSGHSCVRCANLAQRPTAENSVSLRFGVSKYKMRSRYPEKPAKHMPNSMFRLIRKDVSECLNKLKPQTVSSRRLLQALSNDQRFS
jgi:hypothetical protein